VDDIRAAQLADEKRQVRQLGDDRSNIFDAGSVAQHTERDRIDRNEPSLDCRVVTPLLKELVGCDGLSPEDTERRGDDCDAESAHRWESVSSLIRAAGPFRILQMARRTRCDGPSSLALHGRPRTFQVDARSAKRIRRAQTFN
jgi:hypothetical protein